MSSLFERAVVPIASKSDAEATRDAFGPYLDGVDGTVIVVYVVEKAGGAPDKASVEQREAVGEDAFDVVRERLAGTGVEAETRILYGTDVAETIIDAAAEEDASSIVFTPRGGSRIVDFLTGDTARSLVHETDRPVIVLPKPGGANG